METNTLFPVKVAKEIATKEVTDWLDYKRIKEPRREVLKANIDTLIEACMYGEIEFSDNAITQNLNFPIYNDDGTLFRNKLKYKTTITVKEIQTSIEKNTLMVQAYASALTGLPGEVVGKLDASTDYNVLNSIVVFFTPS